MSDTVTFTAEEIDEMAKAVDECANEFDYNVVIDRQSPTAALAHKGAALLRMIAASLTAHAELTRPAE